VKAGECPEGFPLTVGLHAHATCPVLLGVGPRGCHPLPGGQGNEVALRHVIALLLHVVRHGQLRLHAQARVHGLPTAQAGNEFEHQGIRGGQDGLAGAAEPLQGQAGIGVQGHHGWSYHAVALGASDAQAKVRGPVVRVMVVLVVLLLLQLVHQGCEVVH
jgi:hypothetical protein